ncbi:MAG: TonB-dependent receptor [Bacteroidetes bacterium HGW-Bacteroidetes-1]|nr:MAG: TonB-dependent receptor [Bacteroidetes bacterium HGW-Bacteroidetes-1]
MKQLILICLILLTAGLTYGQKVVQGTITDSNTGETLIGVTVSIKGTTAGITTDMSGHYLLSSELLTPSSIIVYSYIGYATIEQIVGSRNLIDIKLVPERYLLDELVVVGYGTTKKRNVLGAVSKIDNKELTRIPVAGIDQALQGRVAGVQVTQNTGAPGEGVSVRIRGAGSINSSNNPLYIVDGIPTTDALNLLSPGDIENITVLKDASASAIYGSRANNGVVLVTTKKGSKGKTLITYRGQTGFQQATRLTKMVNTTDYITVYNEAASNDNAFLPPTLQRALISQEDAVGFDNVNYVDELLQTAPINTHELSVSGGNESTNFLLSASFFDQKGIISGTDFTRGTVRLDVNTEANKWLTVGLSMLTGISDNDIIGSSGDGAGGNGGSVVRYAFFRNPAIPIRFDDGRFVDRPAEYFKDPVTQEWRQKYDSFLGDGYNPIGMTYYNQNNRKDDSYLGKAYITAKLSKKLKFTTNFGLDYRNSQTRQFYPTWGTLNRVSAVNGLNISSQRMANLTLNNLLNYETTFGEDHSFSALLGFEALKNGGKGLWANDSDFPIEQEELIYIGNGLGNKISSQDEYSSTLASFFGRVNYDFKGKYYFSGTLRRDGSSRFVGDNKWGTFYSFSAGWILKQEDFLKDVSWLENLKLRGGYGAIGNQEIGLYAYSDRISPYFNYPFGNISNSGYAQTSLGNEDLKWETSFQYNAGIDAEILKGALSFSVDYFYKVTEDMLVKAPNPPSVGYAEKAWINSGSIMNTGIELEGLYRQNKKDWGYSIGANLTFLKNEVLELDAPLFGGLVESGINATRTEVGKPIGSFYLLEMDGIFQNATEILLSAFQGNNIKPGDVKFKDQNGDGRIDNNDRVHLGSAIPKIIGGVNLATSYKNWDLNLFLQGAYGNKIYVQINQDIEGFYRGFTVTQRYFDERWTGEGSSNTQPRPSWVSKANNARPSSRFLEDGSYLRLKNLQIGYTLPDKILHMTGLTKTRVYVSGTNLLTLTGYSGLDPEMTVSDNSKNEGDRSAGIDWGTYPSAMTIMFGVDITF